MQLRASANFSSTAFNRETSSGNFSNRAGVRRQAVEPSTRGEGAIKKFGINPMHYPLIKCPSGARQAAPQLKDLDTPRRPVKYKLGY